MYKAKSSLGPLLIITMLMNPVIQCAKAKEPDLPSLDGCITQAAAYHHVNRMVLKAIIWHESKGNASIQRRNSNNSVDFGAGGINSVHLPELAKVGVTKAMLLDGCSNTFVAAWKYSKKVAKHSNTWQAVGAYHSETPKHRDRYSVLIQEVLVRWGYLTTVFDYRTANFVQPRTAVR